MSLWPVSYPLPGNSFEISSWGSQAMGSIYIDGLGGSMLSTAWLSNNRAVYIPFRLAARVKITDGFVQNGSTANTNIDLGIYDEKGTLIVSSGTVGQSGTSQKQTIALTDTIIGPGLFYMALAFSATTGTVFARTFTLRTMRAIGYAEQDSAFNLPTSATFAAPSADAILPVFGLIGNRVVGHGLHEINEPLPAMPIITPWSLESAVGGVTFAQMSGANLGMQAASSNSWVGANDTILVPIAITRHTKVRKMFCVNGSGNTGNVDVGIYDAKGTLIVSSGATLQSGTNNLQVFDITDTTIGPGQYFMALSASSAAATFFRTAMQGRSTSGMGVKINTNAHPLPATISLSDMSSDYIPIFGIATRTHV